MTARGSKRKRRARRAEPRDPMYAESLKQVAIAFDRMVAKQGEATEGSAQEAWRALLDGEWILIEAFEVDGRRILLARRDPEQARRPLLTERERQALELRARGHGVKVIAHEMRVSQATVSRALKSALRKLGATSITGLMTWARYD